MKIRYYIIAIASALTFSSCGDFLEEYSQDHDYVRSWNDLNELLLGDCYMPVNAGDYFKYDQNLGTFLHLLSDEVDEDVTGGIGFQGYGVHTYEFGYLSWQDRVGANEDFSSYFTENKTWTLMYKYINVANNVLETSAKVPQTLDEDKAGINYVKAQAHFLRGFYYFWLTNMYGQPYNPTTASTDLGVPVKTSSEVLDIKYSRNTVAECYKLIEDDLLAAEKEFRAAKSINRKSIYRADSSSVQLLLSRFYLYKQDWQKAAEYAQKVIKTYPDLQNLSSDNSYFAAKDNPETIFSMGGDDLPSLFFHGYQGVTLQLSLYNSYSSNDLRKSQWLWNNGNYTACTKQEAHPTGWEEYPIENVNYYNMNYYYSNKGRTRDISSLFWLRSGEAYMNLAEAEAYMGNEKEAKDAVNELRKARFANNAPDMEITSTGSQLITDIRNERKRELVCEGHRWFDLRRYRVCTVQPEKISITHHYSIYEDDTSDKAPLITRTYILKEDDPSWTMPIPHEVIEFNTGMENNGNQRRMPETENNDENE